MPGRIIDLSSNNPHPIAWDQAKAAGVTTVIVKATEGTNYTNPFYAQDMGGAESVGLDTMAYHYAGWGNVAAEVAHFKAVAGAKARCLDIETSTNIGWIRAFYVGLGLPSAEAVTYGSASSLGQIRNTIPSLTWPAAYGQSYPGWGVMWQFTSSAQISGIDGNVDESRWYGTEGQYEALFSTKPQPMEDDMELYTTNAAGTGFVVAADLSSKRGIPDAADAAALFGTGLYKNVKLDDQLINSIPDA